MKFFRMIRQILCLSMILAVFVTAGTAETAFSVEDTGLDLNEAISIHYPTLTGTGDKALIGRINDLIREKCGIGGYLTRTAHLISNGSLRTEWTGGILNDVFSCAVSAIGAVENTRTTHVWTAATVDLRDGHEILLDELFTDGEAAREQIEAYLEDTVAPDLSAHLLNSELTPLPDTFLLEASGLTLLYPVGQLSTLSDRAGDIRIGWNVLKDVLDFSEDSIPSRIGVTEMTVLSGESAEKIRAAAAEGSLTGIPAGIGDSMQALTDRWHMLTDPDGSEEGRLFSLEGGCFRGIYLITDDLGRSWEQSVVQGIRMDQGCLWGLCPGETRRTDWLSALGNPDGTTEVEEEKAEANRLVPGTCDYYRCGNYLLRLYSDENETLVSIILTE